MLVPAEKKKSERDAKAKRSSTRQRKSEVVGILIIALLTIAVTLARYWHSVSWRFR